jgi:hypothetical protein
VYATRLVFAVRILTGLMCVVLMSGAAMFGASVSYPGVYHAGAMDYSLISESSMTDPVPLYGPPTAYGQMTLSFGSGMNFGSYSSGAGGVDITDGKLFVQMAPIPGGIMDVVTVSEIGSYAIAGAGGTSATQVNAACNGLTFSVTGVDGVSIDGPTVTTPMIYKLITGTVVIPSEGILPDGPGVTPLSSPITTHGLGTWYGGATIKLTDLLIGTEWEGENVTQATLVFDNVLTSQSEAGTVAYIDKKQLWITPEPGTFVLLSIAALGLVGYVWRRRFASMAGAAV